jgi:hypothetical protein
MWSIPKVNRVCEEVEGEVEYLWLMDLRELEVYLRLMEAERKWKERVPEVDGG